MFGDADIIILVMLVMAPFVLAGVVGFMIMRKRKKYPITAMIEYETGTEMGNKKTLAYWDRIGYVPVLDKENKNTGAKVWQIASNKRTVNDFNMGYLTELEVPFMFILKRKIQIAHVMAVMGKEGEEFYPIKKELNPKNYSYKPVFDSNRAQAIFRIFEDTMKRNTLTNWFQKNMFELLKIGLELLIIVMLLMVVLRIGDMINVMSASNGMMASALHELALIKNQTTNTTSKTNVGNINGIPFAGLPGG